MCSAICMHYTKGEEMFKQISKSHQPHLLGFSSEEKLNNKSLYARSELVSFSELKEFIKRNKRIYMIEASTPSYVLGSLLAWSRKIDYQEPQENKLITVFMGPMFAGKSHQLINCIADKENALVFKHFFDTQREPKHLYSRATEKKKIPAIAVSSLDEVINFVEKALAGKEEVSSIVIDELQFFSDLSETTIERFLSIVKKNQIKVFASCLDQDYTGNIFANLKIFLNNYHYFLRIQKLQAWCQECGKTAFYTQRTDNGSPASHYQEKIKPDKNKEGRMKQAEEIKTIYYPVCGEHHSMLDNEDFYIENLSLMEFPLQLYSEIKDPLHKEDTVL